MGKGGAALSVQEPKTYEELAAERQREWQKNQQAHAAKQHQRMAELAEMPDVKSAPGVGDTWGHPAVVCPCGGLAFTMRRWVTLNGIRHRTEVACQRCEAVKTWDFSEMRWIE